MVDILTTDDPFAVLTTARPVIRSDEALAVLQSRFDRSGTIKALGSERDLNFLVTGKDGQNFVLKFSNSSEAAQVTDFQAMALAHIARVAPELPVPRIIPNSDGTLVAEITAGDGRKHMVRLLSWLDGVPIDESAYQPDIASMLGSVLASIGRALREFEHPGANYALLWDLKNAASLQSLLEHIDDGDLRLLCQDRLDRFRTRVLPELGKLRWQTIHNDMNPGNVLVNPDNGIFAGVIDFGDIVHSPLIADVAIACAYLLSNPDDPVEDVLHFVAAYSSIEPLTHDEIEVLFDLVLTRTTMTILISRWRAAMYPDNRDYILSSEAEARRILERLHTVSARQVTDRLHAANKPGKNQEKEHGTG